MGRNYQKVENSALSGFGREMGRNAGKALSNYLFGDSHATPVKILREQERAKIMKFRAQAEEKKLQGKKELLELKHQQELEIIEAKERIKREKLEAAEEKKKLEELAVQESKEKIQNFDNYIESIVALHKVELESYDWKSILQEEIKPFILNAEFANNVNSHLTDTTIDSSELDMMLELEELALDLDVLALWTKFNGIKEMFESDENISLEEYNNYIDKEICPSKLFFSVFDYLDIMQYQGYLDCLEAVLSYDEINFPINIKGINKLDNDLFPSSLYENGTLIEFDSLNLDKTKDFVELIDSSSYESLKAIGRGINKSKFDKGLSLKEKMFGISDETIGIFELVHEHYRNEVKKIRSEILQYKSYIKRKIEYIIEDDKCKQVLEQFHQTYISYFKREREIKVFAKKMIESLDNSSEEECLDYFLNSKSGLLDYFSNISELVPEISCKNSKKSIEFKVVIDDVSDIIPNERPKLLRGKEIKMEPMSLKVINDYFQDYVCGLTLRIAGEVFSILSFVNNVEVLVYSPLLNSSTGNYEQVPILHTNIDNSSYRALNVHKLDPSDCLENTFDTKIKWSSVKGFQAIDAASFNDEISDIVDNIEKLDSELNELENLLEEESASKVKSNLENSLDEDLQELLALEKEEAVNKNRNPSSQEQQIPFLGMTFKTNGTRKRTFTLKESNGIVFGKYSIGEIEGEFDGNILKGKFTDGEIAPNGGLFEMRFDSETGEFKGQWKNGLEPGDYQGAWDGKKTK